MINTFFIIFASLTILGTVASLSAAISVVRTGKNGKDLGIPTIWRLLVGSLMGIAYSVALLALQLQILDTLTSYLYTIISMFFVFGIPVALLREWG